MPFCIALSTGEAEASGRHFRRGVPLRRSVPPSSLPGSTCVDGAYVGAQRSRPGAAVLGVIDSMAAVVARRTYPFRLSLFFVFWAAVASFTTANGRAVDVPAASWQRGLGTFRQVGAANSAAVNDERSLEETLRFSTGGAHTRRLAKKDSRASPRGSGAESALSRFTNWLTFWLGSPVQAYKKVRLRLRKHVPWSWTRLLRSLPVIDESAFKEFPSDWPRVGRRYKLMCLEEVSDELAAFLKITPEVRKHGIVLKAFAAGSQRQASEILNEINAHQNMVPKSRFMLPFLGAYRGKSGRAVYMVMPRLRGDLYTALSRAGERANIKLALAEMAHSLKLMHDFGFLHRDVKLGNYVVDFEGHVVLADFEGATDKSLWLDSSVDFLIYTKGYLAPEINLDDQWVLYTEKSDVYALGICFRRILHALKEVVPDAELLRQLIGHMIDENPASRYSLEEVMNSAYFKGIDFQKLEEANQGVPFPGDFESHWKYM